MKKIIILLLVAFTLYGCSLSDTPKNKVELYLNNYNSLSDEVLLDLDTKVENERLSKSNKDIYKQVLKRQYQDLKYEITDESIDGNKAYVTVNITVYDLYKSNVNSEYYLNDHQDEFYGLDNTFKTELYDKYRLDEMLKMNETINYEIVFELSKENKTWVIKELNRDTIEKIHGLYEH